MKITIHEEKNSHFTFHGEKKGPITSHENTLYHPHTCDLRFLLDDSKDKIEQWKAHILRSVNQEEGKKEVLDKLEPTEALLVEG